MSACKDQLKPHVRLYLLNGFYLDLNGSRVNPPTSAQRLIAFLALRGPSSRALVSGTLWVEATEAQALGSLRTSIWRANRCVEGLVRAERTHLSLADFVRVDVAECLEEAASVVGPARGDSLASRHSGDGALLMLRRAGKGLLPGWYDDWVVSERERLHHLRLHALEAAAARLTEMESYAVALDLALEAARADPFRESAQRAVIRVHLAEDNLSEVVQTYERFRSRLSLELGLRPSAELQALVANRVRNRQVSRGASREQQGRVRAANA